MTYFNLFNEKILHQENKKPPKIIKMEFEFLEDNCPDLSSYQWYICYKMCEI